MGNNVDGLATLRMVGQALASNAAMVSLARKAGIAVLPGAEVRGLMLQERQCELAPPAA